MKLVTTTLVGPGTVELLDAALASVEPFVDVCIVVATDDSVTERDCKRAAQRAGIHGKRLSFHRWGWRDDFGRARNECLDLAKAAGADWSLLLDTDERYLCDEPEVLRMMLSKQKAEALFVWHGSRSYSQARLVQIPCGIRYSGRTHEAFPAYLVPNETTELLRFVDVPKTPEQMEHKLLRDLQLLTQSTLEDPTSTRAWFYLGQTRQGFKDHSGAVLAYDRCAELRGWDEESAWACYRAAECLCELGQWQAAIDRCGVGLTRHAGVSELAWLAGFASYKLGRFADAVSWSQMSAATGKWRNQGGHIKRIGFNHPPGLWEGPFNVMACAYRELGILDAAHLSGSTARWAEEYRVNGKPPPEKSAPTE